MFKYFDSQVNKTKLENSVENKVLAYTGKYELPNAWYVLS